VNRKPTPEIENFFGCREIPLSDPAKIDVMMICLCLIFSLMLLLQS
jgi:hypothetical protein